MTQKGYLKSGDNVVSLCADNTTIGRENCDIIINVRIEAICYTAVVKILVMQYCFESFITLPQLPNVKICYRYIILQILRWLTSIYFNIVF